MLIAVCRRAWSLSELLKCLSSTWTISRPSGANGLRWSSATRAHFLFSFCCSRYEIWVWNHLLIKYSTSVYLVKILIIAAANIEGALQLLYRATQTSSEADADANAKEQEAAPVDESGQTIRRRAHWSFGRCSPTSRKASARLMYARASLSLVW